MYASKKWASSFSELGNQLPLSSKGGKSNNLKSVTVDSVIRKCVSKVKIRHVCVVNNTGVGEFVNSAKASNKNADISKPGVFTILIVIRQGSMPCWQESIYSICQK